MNKLVRRILLILSFLFFAVAAPAVVLYALGYRLSPRREPAQVGVLLVETVPQGLIVEVNGRQYGQTPEAISNLPEGQVIVRISGEGYEAWEKRIPIEPTRAVELRAVKLFANTVEPQQLQEQITTYSLSPNRRLLATVDSARRLSIITPSGETVAGPLVLSSIPTQLLWSPDSTSFVVGYTDSSRQLVTISDTRLLSQELPDFSESSIVWDPRLPGRLLVLSQAGLLQSYSVTTGKYVAIAEDIAQFALTSRQIIATHNDNTITWHSLTGEVQQTRSYDGLTRIDRIIAAPEGLIALQDAEGGVFAIGTDGELIPVSVSGTMVGFSPSGRMLLVQQGQSELAVFNVTNERAAHIPLRQLHTILRLSRPIRDPQWFAGGTHVVFQVDDELVISEVDTRDAPRQFLVDTTNTGDAKAVVGEDGYEMMYVKRSGNTTSLFSKDLVLSEDR